MRGEHRKVSVTVPAKRGSSPHARGALETVKSRGGGPGIIPACAGSTCAACLWCRHTRDHPRMRGEHSRIASPGVYSVGSSPHARGARDGAVERRALQGIIPACAGSTALLSGLRISLQDHPRMRGEHLSARLASATHGGSSPHARGALIGKVSGKLLHGIIPACAGSTRRYRPS